MYILREEEILFFFFFFFFFGGGGEIERLPFRFKAYREKDSRRNTLMDNIYKGRLQKIFSWRSQSQDRETGKKDVQRASK